jgi:hypothetical protein
VKQTYFYEWVGRSTGERKNHIDDAYFDQPSTLIWIEYKEQIYQHIQVNENKMELCLTWKSVMERSDGRLDYCDGIKETLDRWL